jgi:hypothetical protein
MPDAKICKRDPVIATNPVRTAASRPMRIRLTCRDAARLVLAGEDRALSAGERVRLRLHLLACRMCPRFVRQVHFMRQALGRWQAYTENEAD